ncbi:MAG: DUF3857 domain-containing protein [Planctomycetota bacterium]
MSKLHYILNAFLLGLASFAIAGSDADFDRAASWRELGDRVPSQDLARGLREFYSGNLNAALESFTTAEKIHHEHPALYGLSLLALGENDYQKSLGYLCRAVSDGKNSPWAEIYLDQIWRILPYCADPKPFLKLAHQSSEDVKMRPHLRDLVRITRGKWLMHIGQFDAVAEVLKPLQYLTHWALVGPLDNRDGAGFMIAREPEKFIDFEKMIEGRNRSVCWFRPHARPDDGKINLAELFEPRIHVLAYAVTFVQADTSGWAVLRASCAGALTVSVNDEPVGNVSAYHDFGADKLATPVYLHRGWNQILVKTAIIENTEWGFALRLCQPGGGPLSGLRVDHSASALAAYQADKKDRKRPPEGEQPPMDLGLRSLLEAQLKHDSQNISLWLANGWLLDASKVGNKEDRVAPKQVAKAIELAPNSPHLRLALAVVSDDHNEARQALEVARRTHPDLPAALEQLACLAIESDLNVIAEDYARQAYRRFGVERSGVCGLAMAKVFSGEGRKKSKSRRGNSTDDLRCAEALCWLRPFVEKHPYLPEGWQQLVNLENGSQTLRRDSLQRALNYCGGNNELRRRWAENLTSIGKELEAAEFMTVGLRANPFSISAVIELANQYRKAGQLVSATRVLEEMRQCAPENPDLLAALGQAYHYAERATDALQLFREVMRLKPNSPHIKDYIAQLSGLDRQFFAPYDLTLKDLVIPQADAYPNDNSINILNQEVVRVNPNGSASRMIHRIAKALRQPGVQEVNQYTIYYEPERQIVEILRAVVITPDGRELSRADISDRSTSAAMGVQTRIYDEHYLKQVRFKDLEPGSLVDLQYTIRDTSDNLYGDYFADTFYLSDDLPTVKSQYVLDYPRNLAIQTRVFNTKSLEEQVSEPDPQRKILKWELNNTPGIIRERGMPPVRDQLAQLQVTTMKSWQEVGQWYWHLIKDQLTVTDELRKVILELTKNCKTQTDKLRVIHDFVIRKIRYLGIEFGRNGYKPHKASETYQALYGDCKDTATLLAAVLPVVGIDCSLVLIRTINAGAVPADSLPMPNLFNHCIAYIPNCEGQDYWIDGTTDFNRLGEVPWSDQGAQTLVVDANGGKFVKTPTSKSPENLIEQRFTIKVEKDGSATLALRDVRHGQFAPKYREFTETKGQYERYMKDYAAKRFNGGKVLTALDGAPRLNISGPDDQGPLWMDSEFQTSALTVPSGECKALPTTFESLQLSSRYAVEIKRKHELEFWYCWGRNTNITYQLDQALKVVSLPEEVQLNKSFGKYNRKVKQIGDTVTIDEEFELTHRRVSVAEYEQFRVFCNQVDAFMEQKVLLESKK